MKKYLYLLLPALLIFCAGHAQIKKGEVFLGGTVSFNKSNSTYNYGGDTSFTKQKITTIGPSIGWAVKDNLEFGVRFSYSYSNADQYADYPGSQYKYKNFNHYRAYALDVYLRRYKDLGHGFALYGEGDLMGGGSSTKIASNDVDNYADVKGWFVNASLSGGMTYRASHRWMLEAGFMGLLSAGYGRSRDDGQDVGLAGASSKDDYFSIASNLSQVLHNFSFGFRYILN